MIRKLLLAGWVSSSSFAMFASCHEAAVEQDECEVPMPIMQADSIEPSVTGFERCLGQKVHRAEPVACSAPTPSVGVCFAGGECFTSEDCDADAYGSCELVLGGGRCECLYGCVSDDDCASDEVCVCGARAGGFPPRTRCVPASCTSSADCGNHLCRLVYLGDGCESAWRIACSTANDDCQANEDCRADELCMPHHDGWVCVPAEACDVAETGG